MRRAVSLPLGLRLALAGGRENAARLALTTLGVSIGVTLILLALTALPALQGREDRLAWHRSGPSTAPSATDPALWLATDDHYLGRALFRAQVAALGAQPPVPPGLTGLPSPGEVAVSPALRHLLASTPYDQLGARFPGRVTAVIGQAALAHPDELVAIVGRSPDELRAAGAVEISGIETQASAFVVNGALKVLLTVGVIGLLVPVVIFTSTVTRVAAARREQRFAALRLVGATRGQIAVMAAAETAAAALVGAGVGWLGYVVGRPVVARLVTFDGAHFMSSDVVAPAGQMVLVLVGVPLIATAATVGALFRVQMTPLGVSRRVRRPPPGAWRLIPLGAGLIGLALAAVTDVLTATSKSGIVVAQWVIGGSFLTLLLGLFLSGAWICRAVARLMSRFSQRATALMAARRMAADPHATFRAISGIIIAVFVTTMFASVARSIQANADHPDPAALRPGTVEVLTPDRPAEAVEDFTARLAAIPGVRQVIAARAAPGSGVLVVSCADLAAAVNVSCAGTLNLAGRSPLGLREVSSLADATPMTAQLPIRAVYVLTEGTAEAEERTRSLAAQVLPAAIASTYRDLTELDTRQLNELESGLRVAMLFVVFVAACSLTVGIIAGLMERRRPFALLRASGMRLSELRWVVLLEATVPLGLTAAVGAALGVAASAAVGTTTGERWMAPGPDFVVTLLLGLATTVAVSAVALPLIGTFTRHESLRFD